MKVSQHHNRGMQVKIIKYSPESSEKYWIIDMVDEGGGIVQIFADYDALLHLYSAVTSAVHSHLKIGD